MYGKYLAWELVCSNIKVIAYVTREKCEYFCAFLKIFKHILVETKVTFIAGRDSSWPWASYVISLTFDYPMYKMGKYCLEYREN